MHSSFFWLFRPSSPYFAFIAPSLPFSVVFPITCTSLSFAFPFVSFPSPLPLTSHHFPFTFASPSHHLIFSSHIHFIFPSFSSTFPSFYHDDNVFLCAHLVFISPLHLPFTFPSLLAMFIFPSFSFHFPINCTLYFLISFYLLIFIRSMVTKPFTSLHSLIFSSHSLHFFHFPITGVEMSSLLSSLLLISFSLSLFIPPFLLSRHSHHPSVTSHHLQGLFTFLMGCSLLCWPCIHHLPLSSHYLPIFTSPSLSHHFPITFSLSEFCHIIFLPCSPLSLAFPSLPFLHFPSFISHHYSLVFLPFLSLLSLSVRLLSFISFLPLHFPPLVHSFISHHYSFSCFPSLPLSFLPSVCLFFIFCLPLHFPSFTSFLSFPIIFHFCFPSLPLFFSPFFCSSVFPYLSFPFTSLL